MNKLAVTVAILTLAFVTDASAAPVDSQNLYCVIYHTPTSAETIVLAPDSDASWGDEVDARLELALRKVAGTRAAMIGFPEPFNENCKPTMKGTTRLAPGGPLPAWAVALKTYSGAAIQTRMAEVKWDKYEDAPDHGTILAPKRYFTQSALVQPEADEVFCGWRVETSLLDNAAWRVLDVSPTGGARFYVRIPSNPKMGGHATLRFQARFYKKNRPAPGDTVVCAGDRASVKPFDAMGLTIQEFEPNFSAWSMSPAEVNAYAKTFYQDHPYREPPTCKTPDGQGYFCNEPPPYYPSGKPPACSGMSCIRY
jgi:hypothetical protein